MAVSTDSACAIPEATSWMRPVNAEEVKKTYYRPQRSWGKVMFSQASVILFTWEGVYPSMHWADTHRAYTPLGRHPRQTPPGRHQPGQTPPDRHPLGRHPWVDTPRPDTSLGRHPPGRHPPEQTPTWPEPPPPTATAVDGTHPTGIHSCAIIIFGRQLWQSLSCYSYFKLRIVRFSCFKALVALVQS